MTHVRRPPGLFVVAANDFYFKFSGILVFDREIPFFLWISRMVSVAHLGVLIAMLACCTVAGQEFDLVEVLDEADRNGLCRTAAGGQGTYTR